MVTISNGSTTVSLRSPSIGASRTIDSGIIRKVNIAGNLTPAITTVKTNDIRLYQFIDRDDTAISLYNFIASNIGKPLTFVFNEETFTGLVSADEFELSSRRPNPCGMRSFNMRVRVISRSGSIGFPPNCLALAIQSEDSSYILNELGGYIYDS
jgi:hypothetical protein